MQFVCADADLRAEAKLAPVVEAGGGVPEDDGAVHFAKEFARGFSV